MDIRTLFTEAQQQSLSEAIAAAEQRSSGEIRIHLDSRCSGSALDKAAKVFQQLKMHQTAARNGVLIYAALKDRKLAIIGDQGIHQAVGSDFWDQVYRAMSGHFAAGQYYDGLLSGVQMAGEQLARYFPQSKDDANELSNDISYGA